MFPITENEIQENKFYTIKYGPFFEVMDKTYINVCLATVIQISFLLRINDLFHWTYPLESTFILSYKQTTLCCTKASLPVMRHIVFAGMLHCN